MNPNYSGPKKDINPKDLGTYEAVPSFFPGMPGRWVLEPKLDGMWVEVCVEKYALSFKSRRSIEPETVYTEGLSNIRLPLPVGTIFCGELEAGTDRATKAFESSGFYSLHLFDIIQLGEESLRDKPQYERRQTLEFLYKEIQFLTMHIPGRIQLVPSMSNLFAQRYDYYVKNGGEGVVLKDITAPYSSGKTDNMVRCKEWITDDFILMEIGETDSGAPTGVWGQYHNGKLVYVMRAQPLKDMDVLKPEHCGHLVAEFRGCGRQSSGTLRSAQFIRRRRDKPMKDCILKNSGNKTPTRRK